MWIRAAVHRAPGKSGVSMHWYSMSAVPDYTDVRPDRPVSEKLIELVAEGGWRQAAPQPAATQRPAEQDPRLGRLQQRKMKRM